MTLTKEAREERAMIRARAEAAHRYEHLDIDGLADDVLTLLSELERVEVKVEQLRDEVDRQTIVAECHEERREQWKARAEAAEAKVRALRDQIDHGGCVAAHVGEGTYECDATQPCGLCRLRGRAEAAEARVRELERDVATWRDDAMAMQAAGQREAARAESLEQRVRELEGMNANLGRHVARIMRERDEWESNEQEQAARAERMERENQRLRAAVEELRPTATMLEHAAGEGERTGLLVLKPSAAREIAALIRAALEPAK